MTLHSLLIDKRIVQRNIEQGKLEPAEYQRILDALPDLSDKVWRRPAPTEPAVAEARTNGDTAVTHAAEPVSSPRPEAAPAFDASL